ncbi:MAG: 1-deoxy-D-xylulose-5-phosphate synthase [Acetobacter sp.]|nr:1-deoxy-D-xylulose-5-phosphate synthase [Bacteroides sp.]MCM1340587.1 1-deoxy-D-xylulose-5-phosphate synthase [Acetobacter sp.]MCM1433327.1 1-deoxy-D-xylulose-5-phosphate synthase [Clostridiales bacterium]
MSILENINSPKDVKKLSISELEELCSEIREFMISSVCDTGGHLASNLGVVELTVALHKVFSSPTDQIVFDVGHQCYTHKILTGRKDQFNTLRQENGISGFTRPVESEHDIFSSGHSSTSISECIGLAKANQIKGEKGKAVAVIGDGALTGGLAYEALNYAGNANCNLIVILNDNNMSISQNVGSIAKNLTTIRTSHKYVTLKSKIQRGLSRIPKIGNEISRFFKLINSQIRKRVYNATFFEDLGFRYYGPIDGHDIEALIDVLNVAKAHNHSVLIHINTVKGKGYMPAEKNPTQFHGIGKFDVSTGIAKKGCKNFSSVFGETMCKFAEKDSRICCVTAAMSEGTGLVNFSQKYPKRFFDVGIAEGHAVTFSSGLAKNGMIPVFAVYSTFLQRSYDQLIHDIAMQNLKVILAVDRAGFVGDDGESHQGLFDTSYINSVVNMTIFAPAYYDELESMFYDGIYKTDGAVAIRYPRGSEGFKPENYRYEHKAYDIFGNTDSKNCIITYGREFSNCIEALDKIDDAFIIKINRIKPIDKEIYKYTDKCNNIFFFEESVRTGSIGQTFSEGLLETGYNGSFKHICVNDEFVKQASVDSQIKKYKLDINSIIEEVKNAQGK